MNDSVERRLKVIEERVRGVDTEAMVDDKLASSGLPKDVREEMKKSLDGQTVSAADVDGYIHSQKAILSKVEENLKARAAINLEGRVVDEGGTTEKVFEELLNL